MLATGDFDGDGISNGREFELGSDPTSAGSGLDAALLGRWRFNEGGGTTIADATANGRDGELTEAYSWHAESGARRYLRFTDGTGRAEIDGSNFELGAGNADFAVAFWIRLNEPAANSWRVLAHKGSNSQRTFAMWLIPNTTRIHYRISGATNYDMGGGSVASLPVGNWAHVAYVKEGSNLKLYINGALDSTAALTEPVVGNDGPIRLGQNLIHAASKAAYDDFQIYDVALSAAEVATLHAAHTDMDSDGDGLTDYGEARLGTNPNLPDSDWDGVSDSRELADGTDPNDAESVVQRRIAYFPFDALDLRSAEGQLPKAILGGASQVAGARGRALYSNTASARVHYDWMRPGGDLNVSLRTGSVRLWFKPDWSSPGMSGNWSRFFEMGDYTADNTKAWFGFHLHATQPGIHVGTKDGNGHGTSPLFSLASNAFAAGKWHQVTLTYSPTHRRIFLNGALVSELAVNYPHLPDIADFAQDGIEFASDGWQSIKGAIDEVEFFNYELAPAQIQTDYNAMAPLLVSTNPHGLPDWWVDTYFLGGLPEGFDPNGDDDGDGLSNREEATFGTDPNNPSTGGSGIDDGWLAKYGLDPNTADPNEDRDENGIGDGLSLYLEFKSNTDPTKRDTDEDGVIDGEDGWALDPTLSPPRLPEVRYAVIDLSPHLLHSEDSPLSVNDNGQVLFRRYEIPSGLDVPASGYILNPNGQTHALPTNFAVGIFSNKDADGKVTIGGIPWGDGFNGVTSHLWKGGPSFIPLLSHDWGLSGLINYESGAMAISDNGAYLCGIAWQTSNYSPENHSRTAGHVWQGSSPVLFGGVSGYDGGTYFGDRFTVALDINNNGDAVGVEISFEGYETINRSYFRNGVTGEETLLSGDEDYFWDSSFPERDWLYINNWPDPLVAESNYLNPAFWSRKDGVWSRRYIGRDLKPTTVASAAIVGSFDGINDQGVAIGSFDDGSGSPYKWNLWKNGRFLDIKDLTSGWGDFLVRDINNHGVILANAKKLDANGQPTGSDLPVVLIPIELYDDALNSPTVAFNGESFPLVQVQDIPAVDLFAYISDGKTAWIKAHKSATNAAPEMPKLVARAPIPGASTLTFKWRLEVKYDRGNGNRTSRNQTEDTVKIPIDGSYAEVTADKEWRIFEWKKSGDESDWDKEIRLRGFFGGTAKLYFWNPANGPEPTKPTYTFKIGGENPTNEKARDFIEDEPDAGPSGELWFAYAIAKSETAEYRYQNSFYNQFRYNPSKANRGLPTWNDDGGTLPGGYGIFQVTGTATSSTANIPREQIWNWQENIKCGLEILRAKRQEAETWMAQQRNSNNANGVPLPNHTVRSVTFSESSMRKMEDAVTMKAYNGSSRPSGGFVDNGNVPGFRLDPLSAGYYCYWRNASNEWALSRYNDHSPPFNYVDRVCTEVEQ